MFNFKFILKKKMNVKIPVYCVETTSYVNLQKNIYIYIYNKCDSVVG